MRLREPFVKTARFEKRLSLEVVVVKGPSFQFFSALRLFQFFFSSKGAPFNFCPIDYREKSVNIPKKVIWIVVSPQKSPGNPTYSVWLFK